MKLMNNIILCLVFGAFCCFSVEVRAQATMTTEMDHELTPIAAARKYSMEQQYDSAILVYKNLYSKTPDDIYNEYLNTLVIAKKYKDAEKLVQGRLGNNNQSTVPEIDLGKIYKLEGKDAKADEQFESVLKRIGGDDLLTQRVSKAFVDAGELDFALRVLRKATQMLGNTGLYCQQIGGIFVKKGFIDSAMNVMLENNARQFVQPESLKVIFLQWMGDDQKNYQIAQKNMIRRLNEQPDNTFLAELLTWIYTQKNDWDGALIQMEAIDERNKENGNRLMTLARQATAAKQYETAFKAYDDVIAKGAGQPLYAPAKSEKISTSFNRIKNEPNVKNEDIQGLMNQYYSFLAEFPQFYATPVAGDYATVAAQFADSVNRAIEILQYAIKYPDTRRETIGAFKLQLGDYQLLKGRIWDASLTYSQVDKEFKQDVLGEEARFRNAKIAYYRGDFQYAQYLLGILKASTTELIANDALFLSVQITENVEDSLYYPLTRFAHAGLLISQNKDSLAEILLDSIATAFPKHPLNDDIIMEHAKIAMKHHNYEKAISLLGDIVKKYGQDVLGDDALFMTAEIYRENLNKKDEAKKFYEQLIIDFPGSTFVQTARKRLKELNEPVTP